MPKPFATAVSCLLVAACSIETQRGEVGVYRAPSPVAQGGSSSMAGAPTDAAGAAALPGPDTPAFFLTMYLRDFKKYDPGDPTTNPAFGNVASESKVVEETLGADGKPVYRAPDNALPTYGAEYFDQWYRDVPGSNVLVPFPLPISIDDQGYYEYDSQKSGVEDSYQGMARRVFFPLDDGGPYATVLGNQGAGHNFGFTGELHASFLAKPGAMLEVRADDDLYVFVDDQLVVDLGGTHVALSASVELDELALTAGEEHSLHVFYAERLGATGAFSVRSNFELVPVR